MQDADLALWKRSLRTGKLALSTGAALLLAAFVCYIASWTTSATALGVAGFFLELTGWIVLAVQSDRDPDPPRGGLR